MLAADNKMAMGATLWLLFFLTAAVGGQNRHVFHTTHIDGALIGLDPFCLNNFQKPDPGKKAMLLQPLRNPIYNPTDDLVPSSFLSNTEESKCRPDLTVQTVTNFIEYQDFVASSAYKLSSTANYRYGNDSSCGTRNHPQHRDMLHFFEDTGGEVIFASAECLTHTITISPFEPLIFIPAFETALVSLYRAAVNPNKKTSDDTFSDFIWFYGTHFSKQTHLGSKIILGKLFSRRAATDLEKATRRRCVLEAAREVLTPCMPRCNETTSTRFARASSARCGGTEQRVLAAVIGPLPEDNLQDWASVAEEFPDPILYNLEPVSTLFTREWKSSHPETMNINKTTLNLYFSKKLLEYTMKMMAAEFNQSPGIGCGSHSRCGPWAECLNEPETESGYKCVPKDAATPSPPTPTTRTSTMPTSTEETSIHTGGIIIVGGDPPSTANSLALFMPAPPPFPVQVYGNTLSRVGTALFSCGGGGSNDNKCWHIDTATQDTTWDSFDIPWPLVYHSAVVVQDDIWFFRGSKLRILHTRNTPNTFHEINLAFSFSYSICAVAHGSQIFVIGVGARRDEIYVNSDSSKPEQWKRLSQLMQGRGDFGCLVYGSEVFVTGGYIVGRGTHLSSAEAISVVNGTVRSLGPLSGGRQGHQMAVIQGRPAVLGGYNGTAIATIEAYNVQTNSWEDLDLSLREPRYSFGLTQYNR